LSNEKRYVKNGAPARGRGGCFVFPGRNSGYGCSFLGGPSACDGVVENEAVSSPSLVVGDPGVLFVDVGMPDMFIRSGIKRPCRDLVTVVCPELIPSRGQ